MKVNILNLKKEYEIIKKDVEKAVLNTLQSGNYVMGETFTNFEKKMAEYLGVKHVITVGNGTDALVIALRSIGLKEGDEVITTPFTFFASSEAIANVGATPVFVDIDEKTYNIDPNKIEEKITNKTKAILPVHIFGQTADMNKINEIAKKYNLYVIEDACQAIGAEYKDKKAGNLGNLGCFSFFPTKNLGAFGDAGMITTNDDKLAIVCKALREHAGGQAGAQAKDIIEGKETSTIQESVNAMYNPYKYYNYLIGYNSRMDAIQASILTVKLDYLEQFNNNRAENAKFYREKLKNIEDITLPYVDENNKHCYHQFAIKTKRKEELMNYLTERGITTAAFYPVPLHLQKAFENLGYKIGDLPVAERICKETVCLPIYPELEVEEKQYIVDSINEFFKK